MKNKFKILLISIIYLTGISCDSVKTEEVFIKLEDGYISTAVMKDSIGIYENDTVSILHGKFESSGWYSQKVKTIFDKGYINGELIIENEAGIYKGRFTSDGAKKFYEKESHDFDVKDAVSDYVYDYHFIIYENIQNPIIGQIGIPVGKHTLMRNDSLIVEMEFDKGFPIGKWKTNSKPNKLDFLEFDSGKVFKEYSLIYENNSLVKRIEGDREFIYENDVEIATIVKVYFNCNNGGVKLSVPSDKMWTPLYYEIQTKDFFYKRPQIYPKKASSGRGWLKSESFIFPEKEDFQSYKISKQNHKAIYGDGEQAVLVDCNGNVRYTAFFYEEFK